MTRDEKIQWMAVWCAKNSVALELNGEVGFGRECVGIVKKGCYPDYEWYNNSTWNREDKNEDVWTPPNAYHKHPCVAVLGRGEDAEDQLYRWLKWFDENNFKVTSEVNYDGLSQIDLLFGKQNIVRMVKG